MVNLTRIYTRTGDAGSTRLGDMSETSKNDLRLHAYADVDEANASIGLALAQGGLDEDVVAVLTHVQNDLFDVGADFCTPVVENPEFPPLRIEQDYVDRLEAWCDSYNEDLPSLRSFILNGGTPGAALLHVSRTVVRRAERSAWAAYAEHGESMNKLAITYLNRLSDLVFILARHANRESGDVLWVPGGERGSDEGVDARGDQTAGGERGSDEGMDARGDQTAGGERGSDEGVDARGDQTAGGERGTSSAD